MTLAEFKRTLQAKTAPRGCGAALSALWWARKGDWDKAHKLVMDEDGRDAAWVHAYLHRLEGDAGNAAYWYRQAKQPAATGALDPEWDAIVAALLN
jgi:hypothetical protein